MVFNDPRQMHMAVTETTTEVWCPLAEDYAFTNYFDGTHFCQYCGSVNHDPQPPLPTCAEKEENGTCIHSDHTR